MSGEPLLPDRTGGKRRQFLLDLPQSEIRGKMEERTERESHSRREEKWQTCWCCRDQQRTAQASAEKLEHTEPAEKERVASMPQREQLARMPEPPLPKGKETKPSIQSTRS